MEKYPPQIMDFIKYAVGPYVTSVRVVDGIYNIIGSNEKGGAYLLYSINKQIERVLNRFVLYMVLMPDETIWYGYDDVSGEE
jgi:hypothetical protein